MRQARTLRLRMQVLFVSSKSAWFDANWPSLLGALEDKDGPRRWAVASDDFKREIPDFESVGICRRRHLCLEVRFAVAAAIWRIWPQSDSLDFV